MIDFSNTCIDDMLLLEAAYKAAERAYAPYSKFKVGAALLTKSGKVFLGCNVENASFGATICAERVAATKAISSGDLDFECIAVVRADRAGALFPCGICRQFLSEFGDMDVLVDCGADGVIEPAAYRLSELLSQSFGGEDLSKRGRSV